jgi:hypothetical protein
MSAARYVVRESRVAARMIGDELMIMSGTDSTLFMLNATAAALWQAADGITPLAELVRECICARFEVEETVAQQDALEVLESLAQCGIVRFSETPIEDAGSAQEPHP